MFNIHKCRIFQTVGKLRLMLEGLDEDTPIAICGDDNCYYHEEADRSGICLDCEDLEECYDPERDKVLWPADAQFNASPSAEHTKKIFARLGATMDLTEDEFALLCMGGDPVAELVRGKVARHEFELDGEIYFPGTTWLDENTWPHRDDFTFHF